MPSFFLRLISVFIMQSLSFAHESTRARNCSAREWLNVLTQNSAPSSYIGSRSSAAYLVQSIWWNCCHCICPARAIETDPFRSEISFSSAMDLSSLPTSPCSSSCRGQLNLAETICVASNRSASNTGPSAATFRKIDFASNWIS